MKKYKLNILSTGILFLVAIIFSCKREDDWLDAKSNKNAVVPKTTSDFQQILDNAYVMNYTYSSAGLVGADNINIPDASFLTMTENQRNLYSWNKVIWSGGSSPQWNRYYAIIELANVVLDGLQKIKENSALYNNVKGQALFHRSFAYYNLAQLFCKAYNSTTASTDLGLPIRLSSDVNIIVQRSSLQDTYSQILLDATEAASLLPNNQTYLQRPINAAAYALLAKTYLIMGNYKEAEGNANTAISIHPALLDFNNTGVISMALTYRFPAYGQNNPEILFFAYGNDNSAILANTSSPANVANDLYQSYDNNDLRKIVFYALKNNIAKFRGTYTGNAYNFCGIANDEVYFIRAECNARLGQLPAALSDLNLLLSKRYKTGTFSALGRTDMKSTLSLILGERRKELPFVANIRWEDLKRLNIDPDFQKVMTRTISGITYTLLPNDKLYVLPIPDNEIQLTGLQQNER